MVPPKTKQDLDNTDLKNSGGLEISFYLKNSGGLEISFYLKNSGGLEISFRA
jgi:hypothetical protein